MPNLLIWFYRIAAGIFTGLGVVALVDTPETVEEELEPVVDTVTTADGSLMSYIALVLLLTSVLYLVFSFFRKK